MAQYAFPWMRRLFSGIPGFQTTANQQNSPPAPVSPYRSLLHQRDYERDSRGGMLSSNQPVITTLMSSFSMTGAASYLGVMRGARALSKGVNLDNFFIPDEIYGTIRHLESRVPIFRIPLQASQMGDMLSPFVSSRSINWRYTGAELVGIDGQWRGPFADLGKKMQPNLSGLKVGGRNLGFKGAMQLVSDHGLRFEKTGRVFGRIVIPGTQHGDISLLDDVFLMERPSTKSGGFAQLWEASSRQTTIFRALPEDHKFVQLADRWLGGLSDKSKLRLRQTGGFIKHYVGSYLGEYVRAMNRFLQEPLPLLGDILGEFEEPSKRLTGAADDLLHETLDRFIDGKHVPGPKKIPFSKLTFAWMRPYVSDPNITKSPLKMLAALSAKGSFYTMGIPAAYMTLSHLRRQFDEGGDSAISGPLFAGIGLGVGSLLRTQRVNWRGFGSMPVTRSQLIGAAVGGFVGVSSAFDKGFTAGAGALYSRFRMASSRVWNWIGAQEAAQRQEGLFPGITSPVTAAGFGMFGGILGYLHKEIGTTRSILGFDRGFLQEVAPEFQHVRELMRKANIDIAETGGRNFLLNRHIARDARQAFDDLFAKYAARDTPGFTAATREAYEILSGTWRGAAPRSEAGLLATMIQDRLANPDDKAVSGLRERLQSESSRRNYAKQLYGEAQDMLGAIQGHALEDRKLGRGVMGRVWQSVKSAFTGSKPGFIRGAVRGMAAFTGISVVGALAAGPLGGNFSLGDLVPGWLVNLTGGGMTPRETDEVFTGEKEVAVRKARWWIFGRSPFEGGKVQYFRKHRAVLMQSDAEDNALYGSYDEKMAYEPILHPLSFLFSNDFKYHREQRLSLISPTPLTGRILTDVPIFGELLANTVGQVIKPTLPIRPGEWMSGDTSLARGLVSDREPVKVPEGYGQWHAMRNAPAVPELGGLQHVAARMPHGMQHSLKWTYERMSEQAGLRGFMMSTMLEQLGYRTRTYEPVVESADSIFSGRAKFWSLNLGDPGYTEGIRRYLTKDRNEYYNPLRNLAPSWLPEVNYFKDFHHGNYYNKVNEGAIRLPGPGLQTLYPELRGINPENYPLAYKYKVLTDVAYQSDEWKFTKERVIHALQADTMSAREKKIVADVNRQIEERSKKRSFRNYQFDKDRLKKVKLHVSAVFEDGTFSVTEFGKRQMSLGGLNFSMAALTRQMMEQHNLATVAAAERMARDKRHEIVGHIRETLKPGTEIEAYISASESEQYENAMTQVYIPGLSGDLRKMGAEVKDDEFAASARYNTAQKGLGRAWELFTHNIDLPLTPALALNQLLPFHPQSKFIQRLTPSELYARTQVYSRDIQMWQRYKEDFLESAVNENMAKLVGDFVPRKVQYRRALSEYFDKMTWLKNFVLEQAARQKKNDVVAEYYQEKRRQTLFGADPYRGFSNIWRALPRSERDFYRDFIREKDEAERAKILALVPENTKHIYTAQWQRRDIQALRNKIDSGQGDESDRQTLSAMYNLQRVEGMNWNKDLQREYEHETQGMDITYADWMRLKRIERYFQTFKMPPSNWVGFDPRVDLEDVKLKVAKQEGIDIHDLDLWESREVTLDSKPYVGEAASVIEDWEEGDALKPGQLEAQIRKLLQNAQSLIAVTPLPPGSQSRVVMMGRDSQTTQIQQILGGHGVI